MRDVFGADGLLGEAPFERRAQRGITVGLQERVEPLDLRDPRARTPVGQLREIRERRGAEIDQMLTLEIPTRSLAGHGGHALRTMLRQDRPGSRLPLARVLGAEATSHDADAIAIEVQRAGQPRSRRVASNTDGRRA